LIYRIFKLNIITFLLNNHKYNYHHHDLKFLNHDIPFLTSKYILGKNIIGMIGVSKSVSLPDTYAKSLKSLSETYCPLLI